MDRPIWIFAHDLAQVAGYRTCHAKFWVSIRPYLKPGDCLHGLYLKIRSLPDELRQKLGVS